MSRSRELFLLFNSSAEQIAETVFREIGGDCVRARQIAAKLNELVTIERNNDRVLRRFKREHRVGGAT